MTDTPAPPARPVVALLGTGTMGAPMARRMAAAGLPLPMGGPAGHIWRLH